MPKAIEDELKKQADKKKLTGDRKNAYVYGTLAKIEKFKNAGKSKTA